MPPDILNSPETEDESVTNEGGNVQLLCQATGVPEPRFVTACMRLFVVMTHSFLLILDSVLWRREDGKDIVIRNEGRDKQCNAL